MESSGLEKIMKMNEAFRRCGYYCWENGKVAIRWELWMRVNELFECPYVYVEKRAMSEIVSPEWDGATCCDFGRSFLKLVRLFASHIENDSLRCNSVAVRHKHHRVSQIWDGGKSGCNLSVKDKVMWSDTITRYGRYLGKAQNYYNYLEVDSLLLGASKSIWHSYFSWQNVSQIHNRR